ncbi:alpha/beta hydrolase [Pullulanibacillus sp. KACC 23026]|uniref:alpha/beta hydrolase n=1 Tax=Pullulanibacillus sp. KACC 23026 TaxID=3028315 RepID=UPI0023B13120|nr:alpha/beta hydrolase [Pullulanibacillus sp. KACC 23026]WEG12589.1 alpha/beta hydrolase [Pullulanibacillus sp. KACC 23026]
MKFINSSVDGYKGMKIPYTLYGKTNHSKDLAILLPGSGYTVNSPVFHYSSDIFFNHSIDILEVNYPYKHEFYNDFSSEELYTAVKFDSRKVIDTVLETNFYNNFYFIGKSLGTIALSSLLSKDVFKDAKVIWLTPILNCNEVYEAMIKNKHEGLCFIGDNDHFYTEELFLKLRNNETIQSKLLKGVNHSLDNDDDPIKSIDVLKTIITDIDKFIIKTTSEEN